MRVTAYTIDQVADTITFNLNDFFADPGEPLDLPGVFTITRNATGNIVTYKIRDLPPELRIMQ